MLNSPQKRNRGQKKKIKKDWGAWGNTEVKRRNNTEETAEETAEKRQKNRAEENRLRLCKRVEFDRI